MIEDEEYWINVYDKMVYSTPNGRQGAKCVSYAQAVHVTNYIKEHDFKTLYRIHVRLK